MLKNLILIGLLAVIGLSDLSARRLHYAEEFYRIYYQPHRAENEDYLRNIHWLRYAIDAPFAPPIHALTPPDNELQYRRYKRLLRMHLRYLLIKNTVYLAARFDKHRAVFYNLPYRKDILRSLGIAEYLYREALKDWEVLQNLLVEFNQDEIIKKERVKLEFMEKLIYRIEVGELDYARVINRKLERIEKNKIYFSPPNEAEAEANQGQNGLNLAN